MLDFAAIDFETANAERCSVCSVGIVIVKDGEIADKLCSLIQPDQIIIATGILVSMDLHKRTQWDADKVHYEKW